MIKIMRINSISNFSANRNRQSFNGHWEEQYSFQFMNCSGNKIIKKVYVPDENESLTDVAKAWKSETGKLPSDWVKSNNPYDQSEEKVQYEIKNSPYMPINLLIASERIKEKNANSHTDKIDSYVELAKFYAQKNDYQQVKAYENKMVDTFKDISGAKSQEIAASIMDKYKEDFGSDTKAKVRYGKL